MSQSNDSGLNLDHLEACPFCGSSEITVDLYEYGGYTAYCEKCEVEGPRGYSPSEAAIAWNSRAALVNQPAPTVPDEREKLLTIIANAYQIAGAHDAPAYILDVLAHPEQATMEHVEDMLPYAPAHQPAQEQADPFKWPNGCDNTIPRALRYLANNPRPSGGEQPFNGAHLYQLAGEMEAAARKIAAQQEPVAAPQQGESSKEAADQRTRFEDEFPLLTLARDQNDEYALPMARGAWAGWKAALAPQQAAAPGEQLWLATLRACGELPEGYEVRIELENGCGMAVWYDTEGERHVIEGEGYLSDDVSEAVDMAIQRAAQLDGGQEGSESNG